MPVDPLLQAAEDQLRGRTAGGWSPQWNFVAAEDTSGEGGGRGQLYAIPMTPWQRERWGQGTWYAQDPDTNWTSQALNTGQVPEAIPISEQQARTDPRFAQDYDVWQNYLGEYQRRQEPFNLATSDIFPALAAIGLSTGLAGAMGAFSPAAGAGAGGAAAGTPAGYGAVGGLTPELMTAGPATVGGGGALLGGAGGGAAGTAGAAAGAGGAGLAGLLGGGGGMGTWGLIAPALIQGGTSLLGGVLGSNAARSAGDAQAQAAREANALLAAIYGQNREDLAPWREAGVGALGQLGQLLQQPNTFGWYQAPGAMDISPYDLNQVYNQTRFTAPVGVLDPSQYAWNAPEALRAADYRYAAPEALNPAGYAFTPPSGQQVLEQDPGYQFRQDEARRALEASAAARGGLFSGSTMRGVTELSQDLASQEYQNAYNRLLAQNQLAYQRGLQQSQDIYGRGLTQDQLNYARALQENQDVYGRGLTANELAYGRGYTQNQDLYNRGLSENQLNYERLMAANQGNYGRAYQADVDAYQRGLQGYLTNYNRQMGQRQQQYNELSNLAGLGQTTASGLAGMGANLGGQQAQNILSGGAAQAAGGMGATNAWMNALGGMGNAAQGYLNNAMLAQLLQRR